MFSLLAVSLLILPVINAARFPMFTIRGTLTCQGESIKGNILMVDDNFAFTDHLLTERKVGPDGKFRLRGEPADDCLDVLLIVEHRCHSLKIGRNGAKLKAYTEFRVKLEDLIRSEYDLEMNIELANNKVRISSPFIPTWRAFLYGKRMMTDMVQRVKQLKFWRNV